MALVTCPECKKEVSDSADACPHCGFVNPGLKIECSQCGTDISDRPEYCPKCGKKYTYKRSSGGSGPKVECYGCRTSFSVQPFECPRCGSRSFSPVGSSARSAPVEKKKSKGCLFWIALFCAIIWIGGQGFNDYKSHFEAPVKTVKKEKKQEVVYNSSWDGSVRQAERYLKKQLADPDSYESIDWGVVQKKKTSPPTFHTWVKFRAKNGFGGYVIQQMNFVLDAKGNVISAIPIK